MSLPRRELELSRAKIVVGVGVRRDTIRMTGSLTGNDVASKLMGLVREVHADALSTRAASVTVDVRSLDYSTADLWKVIVRWLRLIRDEQAQYKLIVRIDTTHRWQDIGSAMLRAFSGETLVVQNVPISPAVAS